jgi:ElaB/YqjD/DUF883 family membrane-anchored ribosome-binding protein
MSNENVKNTVEKLASDIQDFIKATASVVTEKANETRTRVEDSLKVAQEKINAVQESVKDKGATAARVTHEYVQTNPWTAVAMGVSAGFILGVGFAAGAILRRKD